MRIIGPILFSFFLWSMEEDLWNKFHLVWGLIYWKWYKSSYTEPEPDSALYIMTSSRFVELKLHRLDPFDEFFLSVLDLLLHNMRKHTIHTTKRNKQVYFCSSSNNYIAPHQRAKFKHLNFHYFSKLKYGTNLGNI